VSERRTVSTSLGSSITTNADGDRTSEVHYTPWGEVLDSWSASASLPMAYTFTGQMSYMDDPITSETTEGFGLMFFNARWLDPGINQFTSPDTIIPNLYNSLDWNRYGYARYNPLKYTDPSGHCVTGLILDTLICVDVVIAVALITAATEATIYYTINTPQGRQLAHNFTSTLTSVFAKPLTPDEKKKAEHLTEDLEDFLDEHPDLEEEVVKKENGEELVYDHPGEIEQYMRGVENDIEHLQNARRSRDANSQSIIDRAVKAGQAWVEKVSKILYGKE
jgi:RHS repeat-associated protein